MEPCRLGKKKLNTELLEDSLLLDPWELSYMGATFRLQLRSAEMYKGYKKATEEEENL